MRDDNRRAASAQSLQGCEDDLFGDRVERRRRLVQDKNRRILQHGAGDAEPLPFATGQAASGFCNQRVVPLWQTRDEVVRVRGVLKDAPILILDEPTSSLDAISEEIVFAALKRLRAGRTTIVIAHRLSTVRDADAILVLDGGRISAFGRHDELLKSSQLYRRMCARLSVGKSLDEPETVDELIEASRQ